MLMDLKTVNDGTAAAVAAGMRVFNAGLFGSTEQAHVDVLLDLMNPPQGAVIVDAGCGVGEVARLMAARRPDLTFILVNVSELQLQHCPPDMECHAVDFDQTGLPGGFADVVMFNYALCHSSDWLRTMREARRLLRPGGKLFINDMGKIDASPLPEDFESTLGATVHDDAAVIAWARSAGFELREVASPQMRVPRLAQLLGDRAGLLVGVAPVVWQFEAVAEPVVDLTRFKRPALQFSGGKDSLACLYLLRDQLDALTVYWLNTGDGCPETLAIVEQVRAWVPHFVEVQSDVKAWRAAHGNPVDLVPATSHMLGVAYGMSTRKLTNRFDCCFANLMLPLHERMAADGVDAVIRGTKAADTGTVPAEGPSPFYEIVLPLREWTHRQVFNYLADVGAPRNPIYDHFVGISAPECIGCTAWWDDGKAAYLRARHPERLREYQVSLANVKQELQRHLAHLQTELSEES